MKKALRTIIFVILGSLFVGTIVFLMVKSRKAPVEYVTEKPFKTDIFKKTVANGSIEPRKEVSIKPRVSGIIQNIYVEAGQTVKVGDLIAKVAIVPDMVNLNSSESRLNKAKITLENAEREYNRNKGLVAQGVISKSDFDRIELNYESAKEEVSAARENFNIILKGASAKSNNSSNTLIKATASGMILDIPVEIGNSVIESNNFNEGTTIAVIADMNDLIFKGSVDESEVGKIYEGMMIDITIGAIEEDKYKARLEFISPKGIQQEGAIQFEIKAALVMPKKEESEKKNFIRAGYSANADIVLDARSQVLAIQESVVEFKGDSAWVEVETSPQQFEKRSVKLGLSDGINVELLAGIDENASLKGLEKREVKEVKPDETKDKKKAVRKKL